MVLIDQVPSYPPATMAAATGSGALATSPLPPPPPISTTATPAAAVVGVPDKIGDAATGIPAAPCTNRTAFLGAHLGVQCTPLEAFVSTDPSDYAYGEEEFFCSLSLSSSHDAASAERGKESKKRDMANDGEEEERQKQQQETLSNRGQGCVFFPSVHPFALM